MFSGKRKAQDSIQYLTEKNLKLDNEKLELELVKLKLEISLLKEKEITEKSARKLIEKQTEYIEKKIFAHFSSGEAFIDGI